MRAFLLLLSLAVGAVTGRTEIRLVGTDLLSAEFITTLKDYARRNDLPLTTTFDGTRLGMERLQANQADLGIVVFAPGEAKPAGAFVALPVAYQTAVVVVPASLPLSQITYGQLAAIYGDDDKATIKRWMDLGVVGEWAPRNILSNMAGPNNGIAYDLFRYTVLTSPRLKPAVVVHESVPKMLQRLSDEAGGIAIMAALPPDQKTLKALLVAKDANDVAYGATPDNLHSGDYPLKLPVYLVFRKAETKALQAFLRYLMSEDAVPLWEKAQVVPLPVQVRNQQIFDLEAP